MEAALTVMHYAQNFQQFQKDHTWSVSTFYLTFNPLFVDIKPYIITNVKVMIHLMLIMAHFVLGLTYL